MTRVVTVAVLFLFGAVAAADDAATKSFLKDLEGSYSAQSMKRGGDARTDEFLKAVSVTIKGDTITVSFKKGEKNEDKQATLVVDPSQKPVAIDMTPKDGPDAGKPMLGIVKVEKDVITICLNDSGEKTERPKDFTSTKENQNLLIVIKKK
jgi:uncharacterized protein (TIGR03067 family)